MLKISSSSALSDKSSKSNKLKPLAGTVIGTVIPVAIMMKKQSIKNPMKLEYKLKNMITLSGMSIGGGALAGMMGENKKTKLIKFKESVFQFLNASLPAIGAAGAIEICKKSNINSSVHKIFAMLAGITAGMYTAAKVSNKIFDPHNNNPKRKITPKDYIASLDDVVGAFALAKIPFAQNLKLDKTLPLIYGYCGYRAGKAE